MRNNISTTEKNEGAISNPLVIKSIEKTVMFSNETGLLVSRFRNAVVHLQNGKKFELYSEHSYTELLKVLLEIMPFYFDCYLRNWYYNNIDYAAGDELTTHVIRYDIPYKETDKHDKIILYKK